MAVALEAALYAEPADRGPYEVYGDWLVERGDPRGEFVLLGLALEDRPDDPALLARRADLLARHEATWLGGLTSSGYWPTHPIQIEWRRGLLRKVGVFNQYETSEAAQIYRELAQLPAAAFVRDLSIGVSCSYAGGGADDDSALEALRDLPLPALRTLALSSDDFQLSWSHIGDVSIANSALASLESLSIEAGRFTLGAIDLPSLRSLSLITGALRAHVVASLAAAKWPALEELSVYFGTDEYGGECTIAEARPFLDGSAFPKVRALGLANSEFSDELAVQLPRAQILPRLATLDLSRGTLGDDAARTFLDHADAFAHLARLDLSENYLSGPRAREIHERLPNAVLDNQKTEGEYGRFVSTSE